MKQLHWWQKLLIGMQEALSLLLVVEIGYMVYIYLAAWTIYRLVALVVLVIAWSNLARAMTAKHRKERRVDDLNTRSVEAVQAASQEVMPPRLSLDTTAYLISLRRIFERRPVR